MSAYEDVTAFGDWQHGFALKDLPLDLLNPRARRAILAAGRIAEANGDAYIGSEHLLLALAQPKFGLAASVIENLGVGDALRAALEDVIRSKDFEE